MNIEGRAHMSAGERVELVWRKSSRSAGSDASCVEVAFGCPSPAGAKTIFVRDSKDPAGPSLQFSSGDWANLDARIRSGILNL